MKRPFISIVIAAALAACGTQTLKVQPVTIQPMHMTIDVNLHDSADGHARDRDATSGSRGDERPLTSRDP